MCDTSSSPNRLENLQPYSYMKGNDVVIPTGYRPIIPKWVERLVVTWEDE